MRITPLFDAMQIAASDPNSLWIMGAGRPLVAGSCSWTRALQRQLSRKQTLRLDRSAAIGDPKPPLIRL